MAIIASSFRGKRVLITGGLGFIGFNLARRLVNDGALITIVDNLLPLHGGNEFHADVLRRLHGAVRIEIADVREVDVINDVLRGQDFLFNLAAQTSHAASMADPATDLQINGNAQLLLLESCRRCNSDIKVVFASTRQVYGRPAYLPVDEKHVLRPVDANGVSKLTGEFFHLLYNDVYEIRSTVLRLTNIYGPGMRIKDSSQNFLGIWIRCLLESAPVEIWDGKQIRDQTYIDDVVESFLLAALSDKANGLVMNVSSGPAISLQQLAETLIEANGGGTYVLREFPSDRKRIDIGSYCGSSDLLKSTVNWMPRTLLNDGLSRTLSYYRENLRAYL